MIKNPTKNKSTTTKPKEATPKIKTPVGPKKNKGFLTIDFIFSFTAMYGMSMVFGLMALTLMMSSVAQYIIFATNRAHISAHISEVEQNRMGDDKFKELVSKMTPFFGTTNKSWFQVELEQPPENPEQFKSPTSEEIKVKYGYSLTYTANILKNATFPIIGGPGGGSQGKGFAQAKLKAYMYREPTTEECLKFNNQRWQKILTKFPNLNGYMNGSDRYGASADNGC